jgi:anti-sigma regulatory factor (Ser/Thr protein kinase)
MFRVEVAIELAAIGAAQDRIAAWLDAEGVPAALAYRARLVLEELLANLVMHARFPDGRQPARITLDHSGGGLDVTIEDAAEPFDPRGTAEPPLPPSLDDDMLGGLGLALVRKMAEIRGYDRSAAGLNVTRLRLRAEVQT